MRVLHLIKSLGLGGAENLLLATARHPSPGGYDYSFAYFLPWKDALVAPLEEAGARVTCFPARSAPGLLARVPAVARHLRREKIDLVHCHLPLAGVAGRLAGRLAGVPVVYTEHNLMQRYHPLTRRANLWTWGMQRQVMAVSAEVAAAIAASAGDRVPVTVVTNGVPVDRLHRDPAARLRVRRELGIPADAPVVGQVAVFRTQKRLDHWLAAARMIRRRLPDCHFLLVGDGPMRDRVEEWARQAGDELAGALHLPGLQPDAAAYLSAMDLLMISSRFEGLPLVLLEAMALELPVAATAVGGVPEAVADGETGHLVPAGDPAALAQAAVAVLTSPDAGRALGRAGRRRAAERFSTRRMLADLEALYDRVLDGEGERENTPQTGPKAPPEDPRGDAG